MSSCVVDASVAAKWFVREEHTEAAHSLLDERNDLHVPDIFLVETDSFICKWVRRGIMTAVDGGGIRASIRGTSLQFHPFGPLLDSAYAIAAETGQGIYDCLYVALAALVGGPMVAADRRLYDGLAGGLHARHVLRIEDVP